MPRSDELADALFTKRPYQQPTYTNVTHAELRTLARDAAKQALLDAADEWAWRDLGVSSDLRARAEQVGEAGL